MRGRSLTIAGIFAGIVAAVLILFCKNINVAGVTLACGILFMSVGVLNLLFFSYASKAESGRLLNLIANSSAVLLGICMLVFKKDFEPMVTFMLGLFVAVCALWQFFVLAIGARPFQLPAWLYLFPVLLIGGSVAIFMMRGQQDETTLMLTTGVSIAVMAVGCIFEGSALGYARRKREKETAAAATETEQASQADTPSYEPAEKHTDSVKDENTAKHNETTEDLDDEIVSHK